MLRAHGPLINEAVSGLVQRLGHLCTAGPVQINNALAGLTMEVIGGAAFGCVLVSPVSWITPGAAPAHLLCRMHNLLLLHQYSARLCMFYPV